MGRPVGYKVSQETKDKISKSMKEGGAKKAWETRRQGELECVSVPEDFLYDCLRRLDELRKTVEGIENQMMLDDLGDVIGYCLSDKEERKILDRMRQDGVVAGRYHPDPKTGGKVRERTLASPHDEAERLAELWRKVHEGL
jgi:hypothetical protein